MMQAQQMWKKTYKNILIWKIQRKGNRHVDSGNPYFYLKIRVLILFRKERREWGTGYGRRTRIRQVHKKRHGA